jgi:hypothetical protein
MCNKKLAKSGARYCPDGHSQFDSPKKGTKQPKTKKKVSLNSSGSEESESDDRDKSDTDKDDVVLISKKNWIPSQQSARQAINTLRLIEAASSSSSTGLANQKTAELMPEVKQLKERARKDDAHKKKDDNSGGRYGYRPGNDKLVKRNVSIHFCLRPPAQPQFCGQPFYMRMDPSTSLASDDEIDRFIRTAIVKAKGFNEHVDFTGGILLLDESRKAYFGKTEANVKVPGHVDLSDIFENATVKSLLLEFKETAIIHFLVPVKKREVYDSDSEVSDQGDKSKKTIAIPKGKAKRARSNTRTKKKKEIPIYAGIPRPVRGCQERGSNVWGAGRVCGRQEGDREREDNEGHGFVEGR